MSHLTCPKLLTPTSTIVELLTPETAKAEWLHNQHDVLGARNYELMPLGPNHRFPVPNLAQRLSM